jgi:serine/threonine-protein kinase HipA
MRQAKIYYREKLASLIRLASGELSYITRRIDRTPKGEKIHMLDMFQITEAADKYRSSMERVGKALLRYSANTLLDALRLFELTLFALLTGNNDILAARKNKLTRDNLDQFGAHLGLTDRQLRSLYNRFAERQPLLEERIHRSFLSAPLRDRYLQLLQERLAELLLLNAGKWWFGPVDGFDVQMPYRIPPHCNQGKISTLIILKNH